MSSLSENELEDLGRRAAQSWMNQGYRTLNEAAAYYIKQAGRLTRDEMERVTHYTNRHAYLEQHHKMAGAHRYVKFNTAPARVDEVIKQATGLPEPIMYRSLDDYTKPPEDFRKKASWEELFGVSHFPEPYAETLDPYFELNKIGSQVFHAVQQARSEMDIAEASLDTAKARFVEEAKLAHASGASLGDMVKVMGTVNPDPGMMKAAFSIAHDSLMKVGHHSPRSYFASLKTASAVGSVNPDHPLARAYHDLSCIAEKVASTRMVLEELEKRAATFKPAPPRPKWGSPRTPRNKAPKNPTRQPAADPTSTAAETTPPAVPAAPAAPAAAAAETTPPVVPAVPAAAETTPPAPPAAGEGSWWDRFKGYGEEAKVHRDKYLAWRKENPYASMAAEMGAAAAIPTAYHLLTSNSSDRDSRGYSPYYKTGSSLEGGGDGSALPMIRKMGSGESSAGAQAADYLRKGLDFFDRQGQQVSRHMGDFGARLGGQGSVLESLGRHSGKAVQYAPHALAVVGGLRALQHAQAMRNSRPARTLASFIPGTDEYEQKKLEIMDMYGGYPGNYGV